jgi:hypothetical protein
MLAGLVVSLLVTVGWKLSLHTGVAAGSVAVLVLVFGPRLLALSPIVVLIGWPGWSWATTARPSSRRCSARRHRGRDCPLAPTPREL